MHFWINVQQNRNRIYFTTGDAQILKTVGVHGTEQNRKITWSARGRVSSTRLDFDFSCTSNNDKSKMRIEELILEGFKSYPVRTQITGWDPSFNAITGLNGSGKSNILDAICFVLGLTNMSSVRLPHHLRNTLHLIMSSSLRCAPRINRISYTNADKPVSPRHLSLSSLTTQIGKTARLGWRTTLR